MPSTGRPRARAAPRTRSSPLQSQIWGPSCWTSDHETSSRTQPPSAWASSRAAARSAALIPGRSSPKARPIESRGPISPLGAAAGFTCRETSFADGPARWVGWVGWVVGAEWGRRATSRLRPAEVQRRGNRRDDDEDDGEARRGRSHSAWGSRAHAPPSTPDLGSLIGGVSQGPFRCSDDPRAMGRGGETGRRGGYQPLTRQRLLDGGRHDVADRLPRGDPPPDSCSMKHRFAARRAGRGGPARPARIRSCSRQPGRPASWSEPRRNCRSAPGCSAASATMVSAVWLEPGRQSSTRDTTWPGRRSTALSSHSTDSPSVQCKMPVFEDRNLLSGPPTSLFRVNPKL